MFYVFLLYELFFHFHFPCVYWCTVLLLTNWSLSISRLYLWLLLLLHLFHLFFRYGNYLYVCHPLYRATLIYSSFYISIYPAIKRNSAYHGTYPPYWVPLNELLKSMCIFTCMLSSLGSALGIAGAILSCLLLYLLYSERSHHLLKLFSGPS